MPLRTGSSWLDLVARCFTELTTKQIRRGAHESVQSLEEDIRNWIATWNTDHEPDLWTRTVDEILKRLAGVRPGFLAQDTRPRSRSG